MEANEYQYAAERTLYKPKEGSLQVLNDRDYSVLWNAVGLGGEIGEVIELVKKGIFHQQGLNTDKLKAELGDCLWYLTALCSTLGLTLSEVMEYNVEKLRARHPNGWDPSRASGGINYTI